jgi:hypothetical protein
LVCDFDLSIPVVVRYGFKLAPDNRVYQPNPFAANPGSSSASDSSADEAAPAIVLKLRSTLSPERSGTLVRLGADRKAGVDHPSSLPDNAPEELTAESVVDRNVNSWEFRAFRLRSKKVGYQISEVAFSLGSNSAILLGFFAVEFGRT